MPDSLYLDIDSPTLAPPFAYDGYSSDNASATKSTFGELSPQGWPGDFSTANLDFDFDLDDEIDNPFFYDIEASSKGMALPGPPPLSPMNTKSIKPRASPLLSPSIRRGPLSYYGSIFGYGHGLVDEWKSPVTIHFPKETDAHSEDSVDGEIEMITPPQQQVSPLTPSVECFGMVSTYDSPVSSFLPAQPPAPAIQRFQIASNSHSQGESQLDFSPVPSLDEDSVEGSPRLAGVAGVDKPSKSPLRAPEYENNVDMQEKDQLKIVLEPKPFENPSSNSFMLSPSTAWPPQSAFSLSSDEGSCFVYSGFRSSYDDDDDELDYGVGYSTADGTESSNGGKVMCLGGGMSGRSTDNTTHYSSNEDEARAETYHEEPQSNSTIYSIPDCHNSHSSDSPEYHTSPPRESFTASHNHDHEIFDQLGVALPLPPPSVQVPAWEGPQRDLKALTHEHFKAKGQLQQENERPDLRPVVNNQIHFIPLADPQTSKSDPGTEGNVDMPQWLPTPETPTFGVRIQNKVKSILKADKKTKAGFENSNPMRTQKLLDEGFKSASLYTRRKRVDRAKIGAPVGPAVIEHDSNTQQLVAIAKEWKDQISEGANISSTKSNDLNCPSTVSLPSMTSTKRTETFETDDDVSSVDDAFVVHTPLQPRSALPAQDRHRRSRSLPGSFSSAGGWDFRGAFMTPDGLGAIEESIGKIEAEKAAVEIKAIVLEGKDEEKNERQNLGQEWKREGDSQVSTGQQWLLDTDEEEEGRPNSLSQFRFESESPLLPPLVTSNDSIGDTFQERKGPTLVYDDILFELVPQRTASGASIWFGSDTVSPAASISTDSLWEEPQEISRASSTATQNCHVTIPPPGSVTSSEPTSSVNLGHSNSVRPHTPSKSEYGSLVQARLVIAPATEILIPVILDDAYCLNTPPPRVTYEKTLRSSISSGISPANISPLVPTSLHKPPVLKRTTTLCSPGVGKGDRSHVPLSHKSISKPLAATEYIGSAPPITNDDLTVDSVFMVPIGHAPLPLRKSQSQESVRTTPSPVLSRRPSGGDIVSTNSLDNICGAGGLQAPLFGSQYGDESLKYGPLPERNELRLSPATPLLKAPLEQKTRFEISGDKPSELHHRLEKPLGSSSRLAPTSLRVTLPSSPRPVKGINTIPSPISIPTHNHSPEQAWADGDRLKNPVTPATGKLIYSATETSPLPATSLRRSSPVLQLGQLPPRLHPRTYVYIPYTIPRIGGGVIKREHRLKLATGRAAKRTRTCKGCGIMGGGARELEMWFCLEGGCGWELCGDCIDKEKRDRDG